MNNKVIIGLNVLLVIAVGFLLIDRFSGGEEDVVDVVDTADSTTELNDPLVLDTVMPDFQGRSVVIAYINIDSVSSSYDMIDDLNEELNKERANIEASIESKKNQFIKDYEKMEREARFFTKQEELDAAQQELQAKEQKIIEYQERKGRDLMLMEAEMQQELLKRLRDWLKIFAADNGIDYVLGYSPVMMGQVIYGNTDFDITGIVIHGLNSEYTGQAPDLGPAANPVTPAPINP